MTRLLMLALVAGLLATACKKDIHLNLSNAAGLLVIEGNITNLPGPYTVYLSQTVTYYDSNTVVPLSGGSIRISDNTGNVDSLIQISPGTYQTTSIVGVVGRKYHLNVVYNGKQFDAYSTMNAPVSIDTLALVPSIFGRGKLAGILIQNPPAPEVYYNAMMYVNFKRQFKANPINDQFNEGIYQQVQMRTDSSIQLWDTLQAELDVIDQPMYNYFYTLNNSALSTQTAAPANPVSNISNGALGYFCAYAASRSSTIVMDTSQTGYHAIY